MPDETKRMWRKMRKGHRRKSKVTLKRGFSDPRDTESERVLRDHLF